MTQLDWLSPAPARPRREGSTGTIRHGHPFPAPSRTPAANKRSVKERAQVKTGLTPFRAQMSGFSADFTPHSSCLPPRGGGWDKVACTPGWLDPKTLGPWQGHHGQSHTLAQSWPEPGSVSASCCPGVTRWGGRGSWTLAFASCSRHTATGRARQVTH